jgi:hypothetical protein
MVHICPVCGHACRTPKGLGLHIRSRFRCVAALGLEAKRAPKWKAASARPRRLHLNTQQALTKSVTPLWEDTDDDPDNADNDAQSFSADDFANGNEVVIEHFSNEKRTQVRIDATVAKQLLTDLLLDPLSYADFDHIPPITQAQLDFLIARIDGAEVPAPPFDEAVVVEEHDVYIEPTLDDDDDITDKPFVDKGYGNYSAVERLSIRLLRILRDIGAPFETYGTIMEMVSDAVRDKVFITTTYRSRDNAMKHFAERYELSKLYPTFKTQPSPDGRVYPVVVHDAKAMIESLLYSPLMDDMDNLLFPNPENPLEGPPLMSDTLADVDTGKAYRRAHSLLCTEPHHLLCGIILYIDKIATDRHGHLSLEPVYFTLTMFNRKTRNQPQAWRPLGYIPNLGLQSKAESAHALKKEEKIKLYHDVLRKILAPLGKLQDDGGLPFCLHYNGMSHHVLLKLPILYIVGDTEGHDRLCGRYNSRAQGVARLCRHCTTPTLQTSNLDYTWDLIVPQDITSLVEANDYAGLQKISQHYVRNAFYEGICLGGHPNGVHGITPGEPLHVIDLGNYKDANQGFIENLGHNPQTKSYPKILMGVDNWARRIGLALTHQSDRKLPRTYFPNGITGGTKLAGHEMAGVLLVMLIMCNMELSKSHLLTARTFTQDHLRGWIHLLELLLTYRWWLKLDKISLEECRQSLRATKHLLRKYKQVVKRKHGMKLNKIKYHISLHTPSNQEEFGVTANVDSGPMESNHKTNAKRPCNRTQRRALSFEQQTSYRYVEDVIVDFAHDRMRQEYPVTPVKTITLPHDPQDMEHLLVAAKYTVTITRHRLNQEVPTATFVWDARHVVETGYHPRHFEWLCSLILPKIGQCLKFRGCTEHKRKSHTTGVDNYLFRAHPSYRGGCKWHDWALFNWSVSDHGTMLIPAQIITFLLVEEDMYRLLADNPAFVGSGPGLYALCESLEEPLPEPKVGSRIVVRGTKQLNKRQENQRRREGRDDANPNLNLISVDSIYEPISALADIGAPKGTFLFVRPADDWGYLFTEIIAELSSGGVADMEPDSSSNEEQDEEEQEEDSISSNHSAVDESESSSAESEN